MPEFISNHGMRMIEATLRHADADGLSVFTFDLYQADADELHDAIIEQQPDFVAFSAYLWSFPLFAQVAVQLRQSDPELTIVFGGPSAQPAMFDLSVYDATRRVVDALVIGEGEQTMLELVLLQERCRENIAGVNGVAVWNGLTWYNSPQRPLSDLNLLPSPYSLGLVPRGGLGVLQTYRGCPFTCTFCEWGTLESPDRVSSAENISTELEAMARNNCNGTLLVDAGLNLNGRAFRELDLAAQQTGFFRERKLICEVYPAKIRDEHLKFLENISEPLVGIGLQSFDNSVLANVERRYEEERFDANVRSLTDIAHVAIEIIMGLPGDSPHKFRESFSRARSYPCALRVYHCCVLPSALMVRSPPEHALVFNPFTLKVESCLGWSDAEIVRECEFLNREAERSGGRSGEYFWVFPPPAVHQWSDKRMKQ